MSEEEINFSAFFKGEPTDNPIDTSHVVVLVNTDSSMKMNELEKVTEKIEINKQKKQGVDREITRLATRLEERYNYTINIDKALENIWNLSKTDFLSLGGLEVFYFTEEKPVIFTDRGNALVIAPRTVDEEETD